MRTKRFQEERNKEREKEKKRGREEGKEKQKETQKETGRDRDQDQDRTSKKPSSSYSVPSMNTKSSAKATPKRRSTSCTIHRAPCVMRQERTHPVNLIDQVGDPQYVPCVQFIYTGADDRSDPGR
jgi:hypothetical protein